MSDPTLPPVDLEGMDVDERHDKWRNRTLIALIFLVGCGVALWVGTLINSNQEKASTAKEQTVTAQQGEEQAQVEKFNLAQQVADACASEETTSLDEATYQRLCSDARQIVREGPQGAQGIPGVAGVQGPAGVQGSTGLTGAQGERGPPGTAGTNGTDGATGATGEQGPAGPAGTDGAQGPAGPAGADGKDGAVGPTGPAGKNGEPPTSWVVYGPGDQVIQTCVRSDPFDPDAPTYTCSPGPGQ